MNRKKLGKLRSGARIRRRTLLLSRKTRVRKGIGRKSRRRLVPRIGKTKRSPLQRRKRRTRRRIVVQKIQVLQPPVQVVPAVPAVTTVEAPPAPQVVPLPPDLGVSPETPPGDAFQQGYTEAYNVGFDAGFAKGFEDGHKLELG